MIVRARLDVSWSDMAFGAVSCLVPRSRRRLEERIRGAVPGGDEAVVCLAVRSGFDLLLEAAALPAGSEVLLSAITVPDMPAIVRAHGLVPVPVDVDPETLEPDPQALRDALSPRSRMVVAAHLFGGVVEMGRTRAFARAHGLVFVEDCAQSFIPGTFQGHPDSDVRMLSFGPIKTSTAMGGALLFVADAALRARMAEMEEGLPVQPRATFLRRLTKYAGLQLLGFPPLFALFRWGCRRTGRDFDHVLRELARGFRGEDLLGRLRRRPSIAGLALLARRLEGGNRRVSRRAVVGMALADRLGDAVPRPGRHLDPHTHWVFPVLADDPDALRSHLVRNGFDATHAATSLAVVPPAPERPEVVASRAERFMRRILFVPAYPEVGEAEIRRLAEALIPFAEEERRAADVHALRVGTA